MTQRNSIHRLTSQQYTRKTGFTLVELLVVVAIIALLLSILLPALRKSREVTKSVVCMSRLDQFGTACAQYSVENNAYNPPSWKQTYDQGVTPQQWYTYIRPYYGDSKLLVTCPTAPKPDQVPRDTIGLWGTAKTAWVMNQQPHSESEGLYGGYAYNNWLEADYQNENNAILKNTTNAPAGDVPMIADGIWPDHGWVHNTDDIPPPDQRDQPHLAPGKGVVKRFSIDRHDNAINIVYMDTHSEQVQVDDLLDNYWHKDWVPFKTTPGTGGGGR